MTMGAVWDLGSSSFQLLICEAAPGQVLKPVHKRRALTNLGLDVGSAGRIAPERANAAVRAAKRLRQAQDAWAPDVVVALATAALRDAANGHEVVARLEKAIGTTVHLLDGQQEARLCFVGQRASVFVGEEPTLGIDLGGGSLELIVGNQYDVYFAGSAPLGATRLKGELFPGELLGREERKEIRERAREAVELTGIDLTKYSGAAHRTIVSGGTARALARISVARTRPHTGPSGWGVNQVELPKAQVGLLASTLSGMDLRQRLKVTGMPARRAPTLPVGACILDAVAEELHIGHYVVSEWGLREGTLLEVLGHHS